MVMEAPGLAQPINKKCRDPAGFSGWHQGKGSRMVSEVQHVAMKRALASLRQKGLVSGQQDVKVYPDGTKILARASAGGRAERCCLWCLSVSSPLEPPESRLREG
jgi:hypothetical protein